MPYDDVIPDDVIHVWSARLDLLKIEQFLPLLPPDEIARMERYVVPQPRLQFAFSRGILRIILSRYLNQSPQKIHLRYGANGKPNLPNMKFNMSHSADMLVIAITKRIDLGIDVERMRPLPELTIMAQDNFSLAEQAALFALPEAERTRAFFNCWTRKEAYIKATGDGFAMSLHDFDVTLDNPPRMTRAEGDDPTKWTLYHLDPSPGYVGAVCVARAGLTLVEQHFMMDD